MTYNDAPAGSVKFFMLLYNRKWTDDYQGPEAFSTSTEIPRGCIYIGTRT